MILNNNKIKLRELSIKDKGQLASLCNNKKIWDNVRDYIPFPYTESDATDFIEHCRREKPTTTFAIVKHAELVGVIGLVKQTDVYRLTAEIGYWVGEPYWGHGIATQAVKLITDYGFNKLGLIRIYTGIFDFNVPSQKVLEKAGYKLDCIFKSSVIKNGKVCDEFMYSMLKHHKPKPDKLEIPNIKKSKIK